MASVVVTVKVAMVSASGDPFAPAVGPDCCTADLCAALTRAGHEVTVYVRRRLADGCPRRVHVYRGGRSVVVERISVGPDEPLPLEDRPGLIGGFGDRLAEAWERRPPDVVHAHFWTAGLAAFAGAQGIRLPVVLTLHGAAVVDRRLHGTGERLATRCRLESALADKVDHVITTCDEETLGLVRQGVRRPAITTIPCGVDTTRFSPAGPVARRRRNRGRLVVLSDLGPYDGVDTAIEALTRLPGVELVVAGGPPKAELATHPVAARLTAQAERHGVGDRVRLLGEVEQGRLPAWLRSADLALCVPLWEPDGTGALKAMASGIPVIASDVGGLADTVLAGVTGEFVPPRRPDLLAARAERLLAEPVRRAAYAATAADRAQARHSWDRIAVDTTQAYERVLPGRSQEPALVP